MRKQQELVIPGQINLFDYLEELRNKAVTVFATAKDRVIASVEDYLQKGEILSTLARDKFERVLKKYTFTEAEERIYRIEAPADYWDFTYKFIPELAKTVIRPLLRQMVTFDDNDSAYQVLKGLIDVDISIRQMKGLENEGGYAMKRLRLKDKKTDDIIGLTFREAGFPPYTVYGYRCYTHAKSTRGIHFTDHTAADDIAIVLAWLCALTMGRKAMDDKDLRPMINEAWSNINRFYIPNLPMSGSILPSDLPAYLEGLKSFSVTPVSVPYLKYSRYAQALRRELDRNDNADIKKRLTKGTSKYNLDYYLLHTEAFARCFEIYCVRVLGIRNSICKQEEKMSFAYPEDERLLHLIREYFGQLSDSLNQGEAKEVAEEESYEALLAA